MLEHVEPADTDCLVYRLANLVDFDAMLRQMGLQGDEIDDVLEFLGEPAGRSEAEQLLDAPFAAKPQLMAASTPTRFSDGSRRVFYSALEVETAESEVVHWYAGAALGQGRRVAYYNRVSCRFRGATFDLRPVLVQWSFLIADGDRRPTRVVKLSRTRRRSTGPPLASWHLPRDGAEAPTFRSSGVAPLPTPASWE